MVELRPHGQECSNCRLIIPRGARRCVCGSPPPEESVAPIEQRMEQSIRDIRRTSMWLGSLSITVFAGVLALTYWLADRL